MIQYQHFINDVEIDEPLNFANFSINIKRDPESHGVMFESSVGELGFYGSASDILIELESVYGVEALAIYKVIATCGQQVDLIKGKLLFAKFRKSCGTTCIVYMPVEQNDCTLTLRNRIDQKVDLDKPTAFDGITGLMPYDGLNFPMNLPAQALDARSEAYVKDEGDFVDYIAADTVFSGTSVDARPSYGKSVFDSIDQSEFLPSVQANESAAFNYPVSPFLLFDDNSTCFGDLVFNYEFRLKGRLKVDRDIAAFTATLFVLYWDAIGTWNGLPGPQTMQFFQFYNSDIDGPYTSGTVIEFDHTFTGTQELVNGRGIYAYVATDSPFQNNDGATYHFEFDKECHGLIFKTKLCQDTTANVSLINETGSRITEAITDGCVKMKSDYYGRIDSQPYASADDGCGSLRVLTSGLKLRNAENPTHFLSMQEFFDGLRAIDNIGWGVEPDTELGGDAQWVRIEPVEYFYKNELLFSMPSIPDGDFEIDPSFIYSQVSIGYQRWETERINGLNEFNSNKVFRTGLKTINNQLLAVSNFVAGGQPIEVTRQQSFADTGAADTSFDNETFIICVDRPGYAYGADYIVERDNIGNPSGIFSPDTVYNWRIRPRYNLMRWWKTIMQSYKNLSNSASRLFFGSGTGNLLATGYLDDDCRLDSVEQPENADLVKSDFLIQPAIVYKPNKLTFNYSLSLAEFLTIRANPYGYIYAQCGEGEFVKGYILNMTYNINQGMANVVLLLKYD